MKQWDTRILCANQFIRSIIIAVARLVVNAIFGIEDITCWSLSRQLKFCPHAFLSWPLSYTCMLSSQKFGLISAHCCPFIRTSENSHRFHNLDEYNRTGVPGQNQQSICIAEPTPCDIESGPNAMPLHSIVVKDDLYWKEERK